MGSVDTGVTGGAPNFPGSLTAAARKLPEGVEWEAFGTSHVPESCGAGWAWQCENEGDKPLNDGVAAVEFRPFLIEYNAATCEDGFGDTAALAGRAKRGLQVRASSLIESVLSSSEVNGDPNDSPNLPDLATDVTVDPAAGVETALEALLEAAAACGLVGEKFIHAPAWTLPAFLKAQLVEQVGNVFKLGGHTVVFGEGYTGEEAATGGTAPDPGQTTLYVTGPVEVATTGLSNLDDTTRNVEPLLNRGLAVAAALAIYRFDPCCVFAATTTIYEVAAP